MGVTGRARRILRKYFSARGAENDWGAANDIPTQRDVRIGPADGCVQRHIAAVAHDGDRFRAQGPIGAQGGIGAQCAIGRVSDLQVENGWNDDFKIHASRGDRCGARCFRLYMGFRRNHRRQQHCNYANRAGEVLRPLHDQDFPSRVPVLNSGEQARYFNDYLQDLGN
jgi:hypothetical protein